MEYHRIIHRANKINVNLGTALAVSCSDTTKQYFVDLSDASEPCITQQKIDLFTARLTKEAKAKSSAYRNIQDRLASGSITIDQYDKLKAAIDRMVFTDDTYAVANAKQKALGVVPTLSARTVSTTVYLAGKTPDSVVQAQPFEVSNFFKVEPYKTLSRVESATFRGSK